MKNGLRVLAPSHRSDHNNLKDHREMHRLAAAALAVLLLLIPIVSSGFARYLVH